MTDLLAKKNFLIEQMKMKTKEDRLRLLLTYRQFIQPLADEFKRDEFLIPGCLSHTWLVLNFEATSGTIIIQGDSEAKIMQGLLGMFVYLFSAEKVSIVASLREDFLQDIPLHQLLTSNRRNGSIYLFQSVRSFAIRQQKVI